MKNIDVNENIHVNIFIKDKGNLLANATIAIMSVEYGFITIKNFQIWRSKVLNERLQVAINIAPPSIQAYGKYYPIVFFEQNRMWFEMEELIYRAYLEKKEQSKPRSEDIDIDEIDKAISNSKQ